MSILPRHPEPPAPVPPIVRAAIAALDLFGALTRADAVALLGMWARRSELTTGDVGAVLAHYPPADPASDAEHPVTMPRRRSGSVLALVRRTPYNALVDELAAALRDDAPRAAREAVLELRDALREAERRPGPEAGR